MKTKASVLATQTYSDDYHHFSVITFHTHTEQHSLNSTCTYCSWCHGTMVRAIMQTTTYSFSMCLCHVLCHMSVLWRKCYRQTPSLVPACFCMQHNNNATWIPCQSGQQNNHLAETDWHHNGQIQTKAYMHTKLIIKTRYLT